MPRGDLMFLSLVLDIIDVFYFFIPDRRRRTDSSIEVRSNLVYSTIRSRR